MSATEVSSGTPALLAIGELAERTGVAASTLRYYDDLGLLRPAARTAAGRRRYADTAVREVGVILFLREIGFTLQEIREFRSGREGGEQQLIDRKLAELTEQLHRLEVARTALEHGRRCPSGEPTACPRFWSVIESRQRGATLEESHSRVH